MEIWKYGNLIIDLQIEFMNDEEEGNGCNK